MAWRWVPIGAAVVGGLLAIFWLIGLAAEWAVTGHWWLPLGLGEVIGAVSLALVGLTVIVVFALGQRVRR